MFKSSSVVFWKAENVSLEYSAAPNSVVDTPQENDVIRKCVRPL